MSVARQITRTRREIPHEIQKEMRAWRRGFAPLPQSYVDFMMHAAQEDLPALAAKKCWKVHNCYLDRDGWGDGMQFLHAVCETVDRKLFRIKYADNQLFYEEMPSGGFGLIAGQ